MLDEIINLSKQFIAIPSTSDNPKALDDILNLAISRLNAYTVEQFENKGVKSALIYTSKARPKKFKIILNAHLDIIPGKPDQYRPKLNNGKLYGAGALDMKASAACVITVFNKIAQTLDYPLGLQLTTDEEVGGFNGTRHQVNRGVAADFVIAAEPTNMDIVSRAKGISLLKIAAKGRSTHGAYPWRGMNAIWQMNQFLNDLWAKHPMPSKEKWVTTVNLTRIDTNNHALNKVPDDCSVWLDIRYIPEDALKMIPDIKSMLPKNFKLEVLLNEPAMSTDPRNSNLQALQETVKQIVGGKAVPRGANGSSDARHFKCPGVEFGPTGEDIGGDKECVDILSLEKYCQVLAKYLESI